MRIFEKKRSQWAVYRMMMAALVFATVANGQCGATVSPNPLVLVSVDWYDIDPWGNEVYMYTSPVGDGWQWVTNGMPSQCIINLYPYYYGTPPLAMVFLLHSEPFYQAFHWRDNTLDLCAPYYPQVCPGFMYGSLVNLITGQIQPVQGYITLTIFKEYLW